MGCIIRTQYISWFGTQKSFCIATFVSISANTFTMKGLQHHFKHVGQRASSLPLSSQRATARCLSSRIMEKNRASHQQFDVVNPCATHESRNASILPTSRQPCRRHLSSGLASVASRSNPQNFQRRASFSAVVTPPTEPIIHSVFEKTTGTWQYLIADPSTLSAAIIDPVLDYDPVTQVISTCTADTLLAMAIEKGYKIDRILETHAHADNLGYKIGDHVFCGDSIFHADIGSARCDFPGGSAHDLFRSGRRLLALPGNVKIWTGHDYPPNDRTMPMAFMTVEEHRKQNKHLSDSVTEEDFVHLRKERDATLGEPRLLHQSLQINIRGGRPPKPTALGHSFLHLPMKLKGVEF